MRVIYVRVLLLTLSFLNCCNYLMRKGFLEGKRGAALRGLVLGNRFSLEDERF